MLLLDTDVISALRRPDRNPRAASWVARNEVEGLFLSVASAMEIERGVWRLRGKDPDQADLLAEWLARVLAEYGERILPMTTPVARRWGRLAATIGNSNLDLAIAATALEHGLTVVTRNVSHFTPTGVATIDPFADL